MIRTVTGTIQSILGGNPRAGIPITFWTDGTYTVAAHYPPINTTVLSDASGAFSIQLAVPITYHVRIDDTYQFDVAIPSGMGSVSLESLHATTIEDINQVQTALDAAAAVIASSSVLGHIKVGSGLHINPTTGVLDVTISGGSTGTEFGDISAHSLTLTGLYPTLIFENTALAAIGYTPIFETADFGDHTGSPMSASILAAEVNINLATPILSSSPTWSNMAVYTTVHADSLYTFDYMWGGYFGVYNHADLTATPDVYGLVGDAYFSAGAANTIVGISATAEAETGRDITSMVGIDSYAAFYGGGHVGSRTGIRVSGDQSTGAIDEAYQLYLGDITGSSATNKWSIWTDGGEVHHKTGSAGTKGVVVQGAASQSENLTEWQDSGGTVLSYVSAAGGMRAPLGAFGNQGGLGAADNIIYTGVDFYSSLSVQDLIEDFSATYVEGQTLYLRLRPGANTDASIYGIDVEIQVDPDITADFTNGIYGVYGSAAHLGTGSIAGLVGGTFGAFNAGDGHVEHLQGLGIFSYTEFGTVGEAIGLIINPYDGGGPTDVYYGIYGASVVDVATVSYAIWTNGGEVRHKTGSAGTVGLSVQAAASQSADIFRVLDSDGVTILSRINKDGYYVIAANGEPIDADVTNGEAVLWFDSGTGSLLVKGKKSNGTIVTGEIVLT